MIASEIPSIIKSFVQVENPYRCILIDGAWGIGKSFQVDKALKEIPCSTCISLFGITTVDELLSQLAAKICTGSDKNTTIATQIMKLPTILGEIDMGALSPLGKLLSSSVSPRMILDTLLTKTKQARQLLIVFDDIERINDNFDIDLFLGIVETILLKKENVKVLFVANLEQMSPETKCIWDRYSEKLVNRSYFVDELADEIEFFSNQKENDVALFFLHQHGCKNLRTLQKAENFFLDVVFRIKSETSWILQSEDTINSMRLACYATVLECTEKIYEREYQRQKNNQTDDSDIIEKIIAEQENGSIESRICHKYLYSDELATVFAPYLITYFEEGKFDIEGIQSAYDKFIRCEKPAYYMSDAEIRERVAGITSDIKGRHYSSIFELLKKADEVFIWSNVMDLSTDDIEKMISEQIPREYEKFLTENGKPNFTLHSIFGDHVQSSQMNNFLVNFREKETEIYVEWLINQFQNLLEKSDYRRIHQQLGGIAALLKELKRSEDIDSIGHFSKLFCDVRLLPIDSISEIQYYCCQTIYSLAMTYFREEYCAFLKECTPKYVGNHMFGNRMKHIAQDYEKQIKESIDKKGVACKNE